MIRALQLNVCQSFAHFVKFTQASEAAHKLFEANKPSRKLLKKARTAVILLSIFLKDLGDRGGANSSSK